MTRENKHTIPRQAISSGVLKRCKDTTFFNNYTVKATRKVGRLCTLGCLSKVNVFSAPVGVIFVLPETKTVDLLHQPLAKYTDNKYGAH